MEKKKLSLEDLKLESFLTEIDNSKLIKVQGGNGAYSGDTEDCSEGEYCGTTPETDEDTGPVACPDTQDCTYSPCASAICDTLGNCETYHTTDDIGDQTEGGCD